MPPAPSPSPSSSPCASPSAPRRLRALQVLAWAAPVLLAVSLVRLQWQDQGLLLEVAGQPVDAGGHLQGAWQRLVRDCSAVQRPAADAATWQAARLALATHSPPASAGARPLQVLQSGGWLLAEVAWNGPGAAPPAIDPGAAPLDPAIVPLRQVDGRWQVQDTGVWSGDTGPWHAPVFIRGWLRQQLPAMPAALALCLDPQWPVFAR